MFFVSFESRIALEGYKLRDKRAGRKGRHDAECIHDPCAASAGHGDAGVPGGAAGAAAIGGLAAEGAEDDGVHGLRYGR